MSSNQRTTVASLATTCFTVLITSLFFTLDIAEAGYYDTVPFADCAQKGTDETNIECFSFFATDNGNGDCAVNSKDDPPVVLGPCDSNPCHFTGECTVKADGTGFTCNCPAPMGGPTCEDLTCDQCYRMGTLVVYADTSSAKTWTESYDYCASKGLTMFMDKSWTTHGFIFGVINQAAADPDTYGAFWMGLNRSSPDGPFKYVDGTEVTADSFTDWAPNFPAGDLCVALNPSNAYFVRWTDDQCTGGLADRYFPLCQATYDFLSHY